MFVELHLLQNFAPSNLNRDDTNAPKDCEFGGYRRARISSQCLKRAVRRQFQQDVLLPAEHLSLRTKRLLDEIADRLGERGRDKTQARSVAAAAIRGTGLDFDDDGKTQYLLFLGEGEVARVTDLVNEHWDKLETLVSGGKPAEPTPQADEAKKPKKKTGKEKKKEAKGAMPPEVKKALEEALNGGQAADLALFGRMLADLPGKNIDAACQVAHALSANKVSMEMDYYTAVDDLKPDDNTGAGMIGSVEFNSSCFYRYADIDLEQLRSNLRGDTDLAFKAVEAFLRAAVTAIPTGKQNSSAAHNPPSLIFAVVRERGLWSLANAFVQPVRPSANRSLVQHAIEALDGYWGRLVGAFGDKGIKATPVCLLEDADLKHLSKGQVGTFDEVVATVMATVKSGNGQEARS